MSTRVLHDFAPVRPLHRTLRDRVALRLATHPVVAPQPISESEHTQRMLRTEFTGGMILGYIFGLCTAFVVVALCLWWAPV